MRGIATRLGGAVVKRPGLVLAVSLAATLLAAVPALRFRVDTDLVASFPDDAPAADDYRVFLETFGGFEKVFVLVRSAEPLDDPNALVEAAMVVSDEMSASPEVADSRAGVTEEDEAFFLRHVAPRVPLLLPGDVAAQLGPRLEPAAIRARVQTMRDAMQSPAGPELAPLFAADPLGLAEGLIGSAALTLPIDPMTGAFLSAAGDAALVVVTPSRAEIDPAGGRALLAELDKARLRAQEDLAFPLELVAVGGPIYAAHDEALLRADLTRTASGSAIGVTTLLLVGFGGGFIPLVILISVLAGLLWTAAVTALWLGSITVVGVGFAAALIGMGVEYGIHGGARFRQLRAEGLEVGAALVETFRDPGPGIFSSALTTAAGLVALVLAHFRPLRELGQVLTVGVLVTLVTTATIGAAMLVLFSRRGRQPRQSPLWRRWGQPALRGVVGFSAARPLVVLGGAALLTAVAAWGVTRLELNTDLRSLRPRDHPSLRAEKLLVDSFAVGLDTFSVVARGATLDEALDRSAIAADYLERRLGATVQITAPSRWIVRGDRLERRLDELRALPLERAADDMERELEAAGFRTEPFEPALAALRGLSRGQVAEMPPISDWPHWVRELIRSEAPSGGAAAAIHVRAPLAEQVASGGPSPEELADELRALSPDIALASVPRVGAELRGLAMSDLRRSSLLAFALVAVVVVVSVRGRLFDSLLSALPLALGCVWGFGLWGALGGHIDVLAISTLPVLFGTGIDLGVHSVQGGRARPAEGIRGSVERSGLAMLLIALTTGAGFGSLGASRVPGLQNAGTLVAVGVLACLAATFVVLPALETLFRRTGPSAEAAGADGEGAAPPHAPETGLMRRILGPFHVTGVFWFRLHSSGLRFLPDWSVGPIIFVCVSLFTVALRNIRRGVAANLDVVLGPCGFWRREARLFKTFHEFAWCLTERYERLAGDRPFDADVEGIEHWREVCAAPNGFILVTAHIGAWEGGSMLPVTREGRRVHVVREAETDPRAQQFIAELIGRRSGPGYTTHFLDDEQLGIELIDALRQGEIVALQGDRPRHGGRVIETELFGRPFPLPIGPAVLARVAEVPIVPVFVFREGRRHYRCSIRPPIRVARTRDRQDDTRNALQRFAAELEQAIRARPHQWFCFRRVWE